MRKLNDVLESGEYDAELKLVEAHEVHDLSCAGWVLVGLVETTKRMQIAEQIPAATSGGAWRASRMEDRVGYPLPEGTMEILREEIHPVTLFAMRRDPESLLGRLRDGEAKFTKELQELRDAHAELEKRCAEQHKELDITKGRLSHADEVARRHVMIADEMRHKCGIMEQDIGRIRKAVGEMKMKEILGRDE